MRLHRSVRLVQPTPPYSQPITLPNIQDQILKLTVLPEYPKDTRMMTSVQTFKLIFFVPVTAAQACKNAIFKARAGAFPGPGGYTECAFTTKGIGQFRPGSSANPNVRLPISVTGRDCCWVSRLIHFASIDWRSGEVGGGRGGENRDYLSREGYCEEGCRGIEDVSQRSLRCQSSKD